MKVLRGQLQFQAQGGHFIHIHINKDRLLHFTVADKQKKKEKQVEITFCLVSSVKIEKKL